MVTSSDEEILGNGRSTILTLNSGLLEHLLFPVIIYLTYSPLRRNLECLYYLNTLQALAELYCS